MNSIKFKYISCRLLWLRWANYSINYYSTRQMSLWVWFVWIGWTVLLKWWHHWALPTSQTSEKSKTQKKERKKKLQKSLLRNNQNCSNFAQTQLWNNIKRLIKKCFQGLWSCKLRSRCMWFFNITDIKVFCPTSLKWLAAALWVSGILVSPTFCN